jgi:hypothetical protein
MKKIILLLATFYSFNIFAQVDEPTELPDTTIVVNTKTRLNYNYKPNYYTAGINGGLAYQGSDVDAVYKGWGLGITLAKNYYYNPSAFFAFDLRGRLLFARSFGSNATSSTGLTNNEALNGKRLDPPSQNYSGLYFANHRTDMFELGAEAVISLNSIRQRSRFLVQLYGGFGLDWYNVKTDQANSNGNYQLAYKNIDPNQSSSAIKNQLNSIRDGIYETSADGMTSQYGTIGVMPSVGIEIGYHLTSRLILGLNHKVNFTGSDIFDGQQWKNDNIATANNDIHHYTSIQLKWIIEPEEKKLEAPIIKIRLPSESPYNTYEKFGLVKAQIKNCTNQSEVQAKLNGQPIGFTFISNNFASNFLLKNGVNEYEITATNSIGSDYKKIFINYKEEIDRNDNPPQIPIPNPPIPTGTKPAPVVNFVVPNNKNFETDLYTSDIIVNIKNVTDRNNVKLFINDIASNDFNFSNGQIRTTINLQNNSTRVSVQATNISGTSSDYVNIFRIEPKQNQNPPSVSINAPSSVSGNTTSCTASVMAQTSGTSTKNQVTIYLNNANFTNFNFSNNGQISFSPTLSAGNNLIKIVVNTSNGSASAEHNIFCTLQKNTNPPVVKITSPDINNLIYNSPEIICRGTVFNVNSKNNISCTLNGTSVPFVFNTNTNEVSAAMILNNGSNKFVIEANNADGSNSATIAMKYLKPLVLPKPPKVDFTSPADNTITANNSINVSASTININNKSEIMILVNNVSTNDFLLNDHIVNLNIQLNEGANQVVIKGTNEFGTDQATINLKYTKPIVKPTVTITTPNNNAVVTDPKSTFTAIATRVNDKSEILVINNGMDQQFDFDSKTGLISSLISNNEGANKLRIIVNNANGKASDNITYQYNPKIISSSSSDDPRRSDEEGSKPEIFIISLSKPVVDPLDPSNNRSTLIANVTNIENRSQIELVINGVKVENFDFNVTNKVIQYVFPLKFGNNTITIKATNAAGVVEKITSLDF